MNIEAHYQAPARTLWQGRLDSPPGASFFQIIKLLDLSKPVNRPESSPAFAILGFSCDEGIRRNLGRVGAVDGPDTVRAILAKLAIHRNGVTVYDAGNVHCKDHDLEAAQAALGDAVHCLLDNGYIPIVIGGGHEMAWGHYQGISKKYPTQNLGIINFDTHFDMRPIEDDTKGSSGTPFLQIAQAHEKAKRRFDYNCVGIQPYGNTKHLYHTAEHYQAKILSADDVLAHPVSSENFIHRVLQDNQYVYLSLCLDVFSSAYAPGVSAPQAFGLSPWNIIPLLRKTSESGKVVSYDIAELSPKYDIDSRTAKLAANFVYEIIHHHGNPQ